MEAVDAVRLEPRTRNCVSVRSHASNPSNVPVPNFRLGGQWRIRTSDLSNVNRTL